MTLFTPESQGRRCGQTGIVLDGLEIRRGFSREFLMFNDVISFFQKLVNKMLTFGLEKVVAGLDDKVWDWEK